jgi:hypothetical protein
MTPPKTEGPPLERLTRRLTECPQEFLAEPVIGREGLIRADAVLSDLAQDLGGPPLSDAEAGYFSSSDKKRRNLFRLSLLCAHLLHDDYFLGAKRFSEPARTWLGSGLEELAALVSADVFVADPDRREELVRLCLAALGLRPAGESEAQALDRLTTLSSVEREKVIRATKEHLERAREIRLREAMRKREAEEAAAKASRE